ncbi:MAG: hypothetical protein NDI73_00730 [Desulfuromonadales bacterium]|nr:hypothetical protein [Desulfuromonadales bacterium]
MTATVVALAFQLMAVCPAWAAQDAPALVYSFDPALTIQVPRPVAISADPNVIVEKREDRTTVRLQTEGPIAPYFGAEQAPELSAEELRLLRDNVESEKMTDYRIEAGIGLKVEDTTSINLGYRFHDHPSLLGERRNDPLSLSGDLRVTFDIKVPFD